MLSRSISFLSWVTLSFALHMSTVAASIASNWTNPNARLASFTSTYLVGERILLSWLPLNQSHNDLWLTHYDSSIDDFALRVASEIDISNSGSFAWTIAVDDDEVLVDTRFEFQFVTAGLSYNATASTELASPGFNLMLVNQATPPNGTATPSDIPASASPSGGSQHTSNPIPNDDPGLSTAGIVGISVGLLAAVGLGGFAIGYLVFKRRQIRHNQELAAASGMTTAGPYEILSDRRHPAEAIGKEGEVHELKTSRDSVVLEAGGGVVHEVGNTTKRPGLHEMPG